MHERWVPDQNTPAGQEVLRAAIQRRGLPERLYVDNGSPYVHAALERSGSGRAGHAAQPVGGVPMCGS